VGVFGVIGNSVLAQGFVPEFPTALLLTANESNVTVERALCLCLSSCFTTSLPIS